MNGHWGRGNEVWVGLVHGNQGNEGMHAKRNAKHEDGGSGGIKVGNEGMRAKRNESMRMVAVVG